MPELVDILRLSRWRAPFLLFTNFGVKHSCNYQWFEMVEVSGDSFYWSRLLLKIWSLWEFAWFSKESLQYQDFQIFVCMCVFKSCALLIASLSSPKHQIIRPAFFYICALTNHIATNVSLPSPIKKKRKSPSLRLSRGKEKRELMSPSLPLSFFHFLCFFLLFLVK